MYKFNECYFFHPQIGLKNQLKPTTLPLTIDRAIKMLRDAFNSATERDIYTGDYLEIFIVTKEGVRIEKYDLKKDQWLLGSVCMVPCHVITNICSNFMGKKKAKIMH